MKKLLLSLILIGMAGMAKAADSAPTIFVSLGQLNVYIPVTSVNVVGLWDFKGKRGLAGAETPVLGYKDLQFVAGAVTSVEGTGAPYLGLDVNIPNPVGAWIPLEALHPGIFGGRDFNGNQWIIGLKASVGLF